MIAARTDQVAIPPRSREIGTGKPRTAARLVAADPQSSPHSPSDSEIAVLSQVLHQVGSSAYVNDGAHCIQIRWGRVVALHAYLDTEVMIDALKIMQEAGCAEAGASRIED